MGWYCGIPTSVELAERFSFFADLMNGSSSNHPLAQAISIHKANIYNAAKASFDAIIGSLDDETMDGALGRGISFLEAAAQNERAKEIAAIKGYIKKLAQVIDPKKLAMLNEETFQNDPEEFYFNLTNLLNEGKLIITDYRNQLQRIVNRATTSRRKNLSEFMGDDVSFRIKSDLSSLLKKMTSTYRGTRDIEDTYSQHFQLAVLEIINKTIGDAIVKDEDFAAYALMVAADLGRRMQRVIDDPKNNITILGDPRTGIQNDLLDELKATTQKYIDQYNSRTSDSSVQEMLLDLTSPTTEDAVRRTKEFFGLKFLTEQSEIDKRTDDLQKYNRSRKEEDNKARKAIQAIQDKIPNRFKQNFRKLDFTASLKSNSKNNTFHGNIQEWAVSVLDERGITTGRSNLATDTYSFLVADNGAPQEAINIMQNIMTDIEDIYREVNSLPDHNDRFDTTTRDFVNGIDQKLQVVMKKAEEQLEKLDALNSEDFFVFHDSVKLYSSIETGKTKAFEGRKLKLDNFFSYLATISSTAQGLTEDELGFLAVNLAQNALGGDSAVDSLEKYLSIFAGIIMFDDISAMTDEAIQQVNASTKGIHQVHVYNLNGVYVPASMILSYTVQALQGVQNSPDYGIHVEIDTSEAAAEIDKWVETYSGKLRSYELPSHWNKEANIISNSITTKMLFMSAFVNFIQNLNIR